MKYAILLVIVLALLAGCSPKPTISGTSVLVLNEQDIKQLGIIGDCKTEEYETSEYSALEQYSFCEYNVSGLNTEIIIEVKRFTNANDLNGTYQYESLHLYSVEGLISENDYGGMSRFRVNSEKDYGGEFNDPNIYYYHLWIGKGNYLIHITSKGSKEAKENIAEIGHAILAKFG
jgi:hypothetical protein